MQHPDDGTLMALVDGEIPSTELAPITAHLEQCGTCRARLEEVRTTTGDTDRLLGELGDGAVAGPTPAASIPSIPASVRLRPLAWAATLILAAGLGYWVRDPSPAVSPSLLATADTGPARSPFDRDPEPVPVGQPPSAGAEPPGEGAAGRQQLATPPAGPRTETGGADARAEERAAPPAEAAKVLSQSQRAEATGAAVRLAAPAAEPALADLAGRTGVVTEAFAPVGFAEAIARLGGTIRLVDGLVPQRLEASPVTVRVIYMLEAGELVLEQRREGDSVGVTLRGPLSADSLAALRRRIR